MKNKTLYVLGDSIARGILFDEKKGAYTICKNTFDSALKNAGAKVFNYSKMGMTSRQALSLLNRCAPDESAVAAIEFGGNDSDLNWNEVSESPETYHEAAVTIREYEDNLKKLISGTRSLGMRPVVVTPLPLSSSKFLNYVSKGRDKGAITAYLKTEHSIYRWQERYAIAAIRAAHESNCRVFDARSLFLNRMDFDSLIGPDGMHPTEKGYQVLSDAVESAWKNGLTEYTKSIFA